MPITVILKSIEYIIQEPPHKHEQGAGIIMYKLIAQNVSNFEPVNERILLERAIPVNVNILQVYAPTSGHAEEEIHHFYTKNIHKEELFIIMGDFNSKLGPGKLGIHIRSYGL